MRKINSEDITLDFLHSLGKEEVHIHHKNEYFYFKFNIKENSKRIAIHTNGAIDFSIKTPPVYQRSTWGHLIDANCIFIDDKTITDKNDKKFPTGWLMGTKDRYYVQDYYEIVKIIQKILGIDTENVYYWGSSAGGTSSIALATLHKGTTAIANNPQTSVLKSVRKESIFKNVFANMSEEEILLKEKHRLSLAGLMGYHDYVPRIFYIQNNSHEPDLEKHLRPFVKEIEDLKLSKENITIWLYHDNNRGHGPLLKEATLEYLHTIMSFKHL